MGALSGVRVLDCSTGIAGPMAAMLLGDHGADVLKVETPDGDPARGHAGFAMWNRNKRGAVIDQQEEAGRARLAELLGKADVVVVSASATALEGGVLDPARATAANPQLVYLHAGPLLEDAPWATECESATLVAAALGIALRQASFEDVPVDSVYPHVLYAQAAWGAAGAVAALVERRTSGQGQVVTVGGLHGAMVTAPGLLTGIDPTAPRMGRVGGAGGGTPWYRTYKCGDGQWLFLAALTPNFYLPAFEVLGVSDMIQDERVGGRPGGLLKAENVPWVVERMNSVFATKTRDEWLKTFDEHGIPAGPVLDRDDWLDHPQVEAIGMRVEIDDPERGRVTMPGVSLVLTRTPGSVRIPAPSFGAHNDAPTFSSGTRTTADSSGNLVPERNGEGRVAGPLAGVTVLDLGAVIAGPYAGSLLAELGAEVIKVEPIGGESFRGPNSSPYNRGQRGLAIDLRAENGRAAFLRLVEHADLVIDNYRPGVLQRLGIDYESLRQVNPGVITLSITGFGEGGPLGEKPGFDPVLQAMSGMMAAQGGDHDPVFFTMPVNDVGTAALCAFAACAALYERTVSGVGQRTWTSLAGTSCFMQAGELVRFDGRSPATRGGKDFQGPSDADRFYRVADGFVRVFAPDHTIAGIEELTRNEAIERLTALGIAAVAARLPSELPDETDLLARGVLEEVKGPDGKVRYSAARVARFSRTEQQGILVSPGLGEHSRDVLAGAGFGADEVDELISSGVVGEPALS